MIHHKITAFSVVVLSLTLLAGATVAQDSHQPLFANAQAELINYETPLIDPILVTADGKHLVALNEPDNRVVVRDATTLALVAEIRAGQGLVAMAERPGGAEIWVSAMSASAVLVIETQSWTITHLLRPPIADGAGLGDAANPGGIAFSEDGAKAWVVATATDSVIVYDAVGKSYVKTVPVAVEHNGRVSKLKEPRAIVTDGDTFYVSVFRSGNNTAAVPHAIDGISIIVADLDDIDGLSLPDADVLAFSAIDESLLFHQKNVGTLNFGLRVHPQTGKLLVANMDSHNAAFIGEGAFKDGRMVDNRLTMMTPGDAPEDYTYVSLDDLNSQGGPISMAMPTAVAVDKAGRIFVAAYANSSIAVLASDGSQLGVIQTDAGPRGLAVSPDGTRLFSYNRIGGTITVYDLSAPPGPPVDSVEIGPHDPTFDSINAGRALYNDAVLSSGGDSTGCFSCHPDVGQDGLAWELSVYYDNGDSFTYENPPKFWRDRKFPRTTQDSRSIEDSAPYHWRGEQHDLDGFNGAFVGLQHSSRLSEEDFALLQSFIFSALYPANPNEPLDRLFSDDAALGKEIFVQEGCNNCHTPPAGTRGVVNAVFVERSIVVMKDRLITSEAPHYRGFWTKNTDRANLRESAGPEVLQSVGGFGFDHSGSQSDLQEFISRQGERNDGMDINLTEEEKAWLFTFLTEYDPGVAPSANYSLLLNQASAATFDAALLTTQAEAGHCDLALTGRIRVDNEWTDVGLLYAPVFARFVADTDSLGTFSLQELIDLATAGDAELFFQGVPFWSGNRIGVDRDRDGLMDGNETVLGTDPTNPDTDGDGFWDSFDDNPLVPDVSVSHTEAPVISNLTVQSLNARTAKLVYETDIFSPTRVLYGETTEYGLDQGDDLVLAPGSNHWKRKHVVYLRSMKDGTLYNFQIQTRGQNGVEGADQNRTLTTLKQLLPTVSGSDDTLHVETVTIEASQNGGETTFTATVTVFANDQLPVVDAMVNGKWTIYRGGNVVNQFVAAAGTTDIDGVATMVVSTSAAQPGDVIDYTVPMFIGDIQNIGAPGLVDINGSRPFAWADSNATNAQVEVE